MYSLFHNYAIVGIGSRFRYNTLQFDFIQFNLNMTRHVSESRLNTEVLIKHSLIEFSWHCGIMHQEETLFSEAMQVLITKKDYGNQIW
jgi:hypothetical protein